MKISFDYDSTLSLGILQVLFQRLSLNNEMYLITSRVGYLNDVIKNQDLFKVANENDIPMDRIHFTQGEDKWMLIKDLGIDMHFDDDEIECEFINEYTDCIAICHQFRHYKK